MDDYQDTLNQLSHLTLAEKAAIDIETPDPDYILDIDVQQSVDPLVAAASSNNSIRLVVRNRLTPSATLTGHSSTVTGVVFSKSDPNILFSSAKDKTIRCWDVRTKSESQVIQAPDSVKGDLLCVDISHSDKLLCAGTEKVGDDALVLFWDRRQNKLLGSYSECNDDDVTQVSFQPFSDRYLVSGSADGLLCTFDLNETEEDDALLVTSNAQSTISRAGWCGKDNSSVYCVTTDNMFYAWDAMAGDDCCSIEDFSKLLGEDSPVEYIIDCIPDLTTEPDQTSAIIVGGSNSGSVHLISHSLTSTSVLTTLDRGHTATVRCARWDSKSRTLLTGGEDSILCLWSANQPSAVSLPQDAGKLKLKAKPGGRNANKPYKKKPKT